MDARSESFHLPFTKPRFKWTTTKIMSEPAYDSIATEYKTSKQIPFRKCIEEYTLMNLAGDLSNESILDLACGEGIYARKYKAHGAKEVVGIDISSEMIELAWEEELRSPMGCRYVIGDAMNLQTQKQFDLVTGVYLLNYAQSREELRQFCEAILQQLKPGGRFVGINDNPFNSPERYAAYRPYGFIKESPANRKEGDYIRYTMYNDDGTSCSFDNYYLSPETYEEVFAETGFKSFSWHSPELVPEQFDNSHWNYFMEYPPIIGMSARL